MSVFRFEHTCALTESQFVALERMLASNRPRWPRLVLILTVGVACLFSRYSFLLGVAVLALTGMSLVVPHYVPGMAARTYRDIRYLQGAVTYGVDQDRMWARAADLSVEVAWRHLTTWQERGGWFLLRGNGFPRLIFPVDALRAAGVYEHVQALAERHGVEFKNRD